MAGATRTESRPDPTPNGEADPVDDPPVAPGYGFVTSVARFRNAGGDTA